MPKIADRVAETTTTTGTGAVTLAGAKSGFRAFSGAFSVGDKVYYAIVGTTEWELGSGTLGSGTLTRDTILGSSNAGAAVALSAGTKDVFCTAPARMLGGGTVDVPFATAVAFTGQEQMAQTTVSGALAFTVNTAGAVDGAVVQLDLIAHGTNAPTFSTDFRQWGGSMGYDNRAGIRNSLTFFRRSGVYYYAITQAVGAVAESVPVAPTWSVAPSIIGTPTVGVACSYTPGTASGVPSPTLTQQWLLDGVAISGATASTYTPISGDAGHTLTVRQTATNASGSANSTSGGVSVAAALTVPGAPTALAAGTLTSTTIPLTWSAPATGGGAITDYVVQYAAAGTSFASPTTFADGTSATTGATITGLTASTSYDVRVAAVNAAGQGAWATLTGLTTTVAGSLVALQNTASLAESPAYTWTSSAASYAAYGNAGATVGLAGDGWVSLDHPTTNNVSLIYLDAAGPVSSRSSADYYLWVFTNGIYYGSNSSTGTKITGTDQTGAAGLRYRLARTGTTVTIDKSTDSGVTWTTLYTFPTTTSAKLYPTWVGGDVGSTITNPRGSGLS